MAALSAGSQAPEFLLPTIDGKTFSLKESHEKGPVVLVFFKISCPVCQYALPVLERMYRANHDRTVSFLGISQDNGRDTQAFMKQLGVTFAVALDDPADYAVSNAYGLTNVPTMFYVAAGGEIEVSSVSWSKAEVEEVNERLSAHRQQPATPLWRQGEEVRDFRPG
jgi:peroxiredoxin